MTAVATPSGVSIRGPEVSASSAVLTPDALAFLAGLHRAFEGRRRQLLERRVERQRRIDAGAPLDFLAETRDVRHRDWSVAAVPRVLADRRVEITGPVDRKMIINALNSGASVFMADFEDANSPTWANNLEGQVNLMDAVRGTISFAAGGKSYALHDRVATLFVRPRGWHLPEKHVIIDGAPLSGSLFDLGLFAFHNARELASGGRGPFFYLPKLQSHLEARLWNDVFNHIQDTLGIPRGTFKATVLIETIHAAFEMDEILYELREHSAGLNCGRWDYIFSFIKTFREQPAMLLPDRAQVTMDKAFLAAYVDLLIHTCHRRGAHAMGGMSAYIPVKNDADANEKALEKVRADKLREVRAGHDGTWVAHPALVGVAKAVFDAHMPGPNQLNETRDDVQPSAKALLEVPAGSITEAGLTTNIDVGIHYLAAWLDGSGAVPIYNLMEDAATAEISRSQVWQWLRHSAVLESGRPVTRDLVTTTIAEQRRRLAGELQGRALEQLDLAARLTEDLILAADYAEFLTLAAYDHLA
jgi:malate synthase